MSYGMDGWCRREESTMGQVGIEGQSTKDSIRRQAVLDAIDEIEKEVADGEGFQYEKWRKYFCDLPSAQTDTDYSDGYADGYKQGLKDARPERLTDDDFETIRIHLNAHKEKLCNLHRWEEAEEYQRIINRFMSFASAQPERKTGKWTKISPASIYECSVCGQTVMTDDIEAYSYCHGCGAEMEVSE